MCTGADAMPFRSTVDVALSVAEVTARTTFSLFTDIG